MAGDANISITVTGLACLQIPASFTGMIAGPGVRIKVEPLGVTLGTGCGIDSAITVNEGRMGAAARIGKLDISELLAVRFKLYVFTTELAMALGAVFLVMTA